MYFEKILDGLKFFSYTMHSL